MKDNNIQKVHKYIITLKVEYHANENLLKCFEKITYVGQRLMYPIIKNI